MFSSKSCNLLVQTIIEKMESNRQRLLKNICHKVQSCILCQLLRTKSLASGSKCIKYFFFFHYLPYLASFCTNPLNLKNKITKIDHKKIFCGPSKVLKNISWPINVCLKYFMTPTKTLRTSLLYI